MAYIQDNIKNDTNPEALSRFSVAMEEAEESFGVPIRVMLPGTHRSHNTPIQRVWEGDSADLAHYPAATSPDDLKDKGITIFTGSFASYHHDYVSPREWLIHVPEAWITEERDGWTVEEFNSWYQWRMPYRQEVDGEECEGLWHRIEDHNGTPLYFDESKEAKESGNINTRYTYGEMYHDGRVIFLFGLVDGPEYGYLDWNRALFEKITLEQDTEAQERVRAARVEREKALFLELMRDQGNTAVTETRNRIGELMENTSRAEVEVTNNKHTLDTLRRQLDFLLEQSGELTPEQVMGEWDSVTNNAAIESWSLVGSHGNAKMHLFTKELMITNPSNERTMPLGKFKITLDFNQNWLTIINTTNKIGPHDHPHVRGGSLCAGSFETTIITMLRRRQLAGMTNMLLNILGSVDPGDDWGRHINLWEERDNELRRENGWSEWSADETQHPMEVAA